MRRLLSMVPLLLGISLLCFLVVKMAPGDPLQLQQTLDPRAHANAAMAAAAGLDKPLWSQYVTWMGQLAHGNLGTSLAPDGLPVAEKIGRALPLTLGLNVGALLLTLFAALPLALAAATRPHTLTDHVLTVVQYLALATPGVVLALLSLEYFASFLGWFPLSGLASFGAETLPWPARALDVAHHLALPLLVSMVGSVAGISRFLRSSLLAALQADYILTARAKGATPARVLGAHALRNALLPLITILGLSVPGLIGGSVILESLFALPGLGQLFYNAAMMRDYPVILALLLFGAVLTLLGNALADGAYALADPRTRAS